MNWKNFDRMGRRRFIRAASAFGISANSLAHGTQEGLAAAVGSKDEIPYIKYFKGTPKPVGDGRKPVYDTISRDKWANRWAAVNVKNRVAKMISNTWGDELLSPAFSPMNESPTGFGVEVNYTEYYTHEGEKRTPTPSFEEVRTKLPNRATGKAAKGKYQETRENIPIRVVRRVESEICKCDDPEYGDADPMSKDPYEYVPGGLGVKIGASSPDYGSICAPFHKDGLGPGWISSGHVAGEGGEGRYAYQGQSNNWEFIGRVDQSRVDVDIDFCFILDESTEATWEALADTSGSGGYDEPIEGVMSDDVLVNHADSGETYYTQGEQSSRTKGNLISTGGWLGTSWVSAEQDVVCGDSGGILFWKNNGNAYVAGVIKSQLNNDNDGDGCGDDVKCTTAQTVENKCGGYFTTY